MIHHNVLMKLNDKANDEVIAIMQKYITQIRDQVGEVSSYSLVPNIAAGNKGFNWTILSSFNSIADIDSYKATPLHRELVSFCSPYEEDVVTLDYVDEAS